MKDVVSPEEAFVSLENKYRIYMHHVCFFSSISQKKKEEKNVIILKLFKHFTKK